MNDFKTSIKIKGELEDVWAAFTNPFTIELWSGYPAVFDAQENGAFEYLNGDISGHNIKIDPQKELIQEWYFGDQEEESIVTIKFFDQGSTIRVIITHTNIPDEDFEDISYGWNNYFLKPIKEFIEQDE